MGNPTRTRAHYVGKALFLLGCLPALGMFVLMVGGSPVLALMVVLGSSCSLLWFMALLLWVMDRLGRNHHGKESADDCV